MSKIDPRVLVIVPCYNEESRLPIDEFIKFNDAKSNHKDKFSFLFVNDGSTDNTLEVLYSLCNKNKYLSVLDLSHNGGKAEAVRQGMLYASKLDFEYVGFLDADLAAPIEEIQTLVSYTKRSLQPIYIWC